MIVKKVKVRIRPRTGLGNRTQAHPAVVYLSDKWLSMSVIVMKEADYRSLVIARKRKDRVISRAVRLLGKKI